MEELAATEGNKLRVRASEDGTEALKRHAGRKPSHCRYLEKAGGVKAPIVGQSSY